MDRPNHVAAAMLELDDCVVECESDQDPYIYAFLITGRSGSGKSVLLLEVMRQLVIDRSQQVIWLDDASEELLPILEAWAENSAGTSRPLYVFVDDFYAPSKRSGIELQKIARLLRKYEHAEWPILVTCGPPEQLREWKADSDGFRISGWTLPLCDKTEQERLRSWFRARTTVNPKIGPAFCEAQGLMISMMFEMREGAMVEFGRRFRQRLWHLGLVDSLALPLALNRLYILAPGEWLDHSQSDSLRRLREENEFSMLTLAGHAGEFIRITHPHLSNAIYSAIRERDDGIVRARDLSRAFARSLERNRPTAELILRRAAEWHERLSDVDEVELANGMTAAWRQHESEPKNRGALDLAGVWTSWTVWNARNAQVAKLLRRNPLDVARSKLNKDHFYWAALWMQLWRCFPGHEGLINDAEVWLISPEGTRTRHWSSVWETLIKHDSGNRENSAQLADLGLDRLRFLATKSETAEWAIVWGTLVDVRADLRGKAAYDLLPLGYASLRGCEDRPEWSHIWQKLVQLRAELPQQLAEQLLPIGYAWLGGRDDRPNWGYVWRTLVDLRPELPEEVAQQLLAIGYRWLSGREDRPNWNYVWQKLVDARESLPIQSAQELLPIGYVWLRGREEFDGWKHTWEKLVDVRNELPQQLALGLLQLGYFWLQGREDRNEWAPLWGKLAKLRDELTDDSVENLLRMGFTWLAARANRPEWSYLWRDMVELRTKLPRRGKQDLLEMGYKWLQGREDGADWSFVWERLVDVRAELPRHRAQQLLSAGYEWLCGREDNSSWAHVWEKLVSVRTDLPKHDVEQLLRLGYEWLHGREYRYDWTLVWQPLYDCEYKAEEGESLQTSAWEWLRRPENAEKRKWNIIWENCFELGFRDGEFLDAGSKWFFAHRHLPFAYAPAQKLLEAGRNGEIVQWVRTWLTDNFDQRSWMHGWKPLWDCDPSAETAGLLLAWLNRRPHVPAISWLTQQFLDSGDSKAIRILQDWVGSHRESPAANAILAVFRKNKRDIRDDR